MTDFVDIPFDTSAADYEDIALAYLQSRWPDWVPADGDPEVIQIEALAPIAEDLGTVLSNMSKAALIQFGVQLLNQPYGVGTSAYTTVTFTVEDNAGHTIPAFGALEIDGVAFQLLGDVEVPAGSTTADGIVASVDPTAAANGLTGDTSISALTMPSFVTGMAVVGVTDGGSDPQTDDDYASQLSRDRRLNSKALVVGLDYELEALDTPGIGRAHADMPTTRNVTVTVLGTDGAAANAGVKTSLANAYAATKAVNAAVTISDPTFNPIDVAYTAQRESGYDTVDLEARINAALVQELSPLTHGLPDAGDPGSAVTTWINDPYIYALRLVQVIGNQPGVHRVESLTINGGADLADFAMAGAVPVPEPGTMTGTIVS